MIRRRTLLAGAAGGTGAALAGQEFAHADSRGFPSDPYTLGVASGDPTESAVVIWTRLAPSPLTPETNFGMPNYSVVPVNWRVALSEADLAHPQKCVRMGTAFALRESGFSLHVDVTQLSADTWYYYQFTAGGWSSPIGRTRTTPRAGDTRPLKFAVVNCQNLANPDKPGGVPNPAYFHGWTDIAQRDDLDFVIHLGDYIYEFGRAAHIPPRPILTVDDYRVRYGQYKMRESLREAHRRYPMYLIPDDHEFVNDIKGGQISAPAAITRFNNAVEVFWEHLPFRHARPGEVTSTTPNRINSSRFIRWGNVLDLFLGDCRQWRTDTSMLGETLQNKLMSWLRTSDATWTTIAVGVPLTGLGGPSGWVQTDRAAITTELAERKATTPATFNPIVLSGDLHCGVITHTRRDPGVGSALVATEFINAPMGSGGNGKWVPETDPGALYKAYNQPEANWDSYRGYSTYAMTPEKLTVEYVLTNQHLDPEGTVFLGGTWELEAGGAVGSVREV